MALAEDIAQSYKMTSLDNDINQHFQDAIDVIQQHSDNSFCGQDYNYYETLGPQQPPVCQISCCLITHPSDVPTTPVCDWNDITQLWPQVIPDVSLCHPVSVETPQFYSVLPVQKNNKGDHIFHHPRTRCAGRKKLRLYEYLHEALNDPNMGDSIQWTDSGSGTFHFVSKNKEKLAECWGQRKGNRKTMTYQKMARALRNYSRTGEIIKVRRKLTYQFNPVILQRLGAAKLSRHAAAHAAHEAARAPQNVPPEQSCYGATLPDWPSWYGHYPPHEHYELSSGFTAHGVPKA
ncbi:transcription factor Spi-C isoform X2 [Lampris incognitus]|uniref:transcription factor Spi-C isoform X2 n=1 Tax=Lampris incognitus TaxID=2546036 RepID=UPI0024B5E83F|nr:transcription factor Spi-C isoform X2 [Lampris incognitus]